MFRGEDPHWELGRLSGVTEDSLQLLHDVGGRSHAQDSIWTLVQDVHSEELRRDRGTRMSIKTKLKVVEQYKLDSS